MPSPTKPLAHGQPAQVYEMAGENAGSGEKTRILAGILRKKGIAWFFKMTGPDALVTGQGGDAGVSAPGMGGGGSQ
jgi:hypothetical protein